MLRIQNTIIDQLSETAFNGHIKDRDIYIPESYQGELPEFVKENYTKDYNAETGLSYFNGIMFRH